jgi:hypothetical protein
MKIRQIFTVSLLLILFSSTNMVFAKKNAKYPNKSCEAIYKAIEHFLHNADKHWNKTRDYGKASFNTQAAANYATVYATFCKDK